MGTSSIAQYQPVAEPISHDLKVADAVWIATALLHRRNPQSGGFSTEAIVADVQSLHLTKAAFRSIWQHVNQHCVANREPNPNRTRMLYAIGKGDRRLFRDGDNYKADREGSPTHPDWNSLPSEYRDLQTWYETEWNHSTEDPLLALIGSGKDIWTDEHADEYVKRLREEW
jgi:hypothetical protein